MDGGRFKPAAFLFVGEDEGAQSSTVEATFPGQYGISISVDDGLEGRLARGDHLSRDIVGIDPASAEIAKQTGHRRFA